MSSPAVASLISSLTAFSSSLREAKRKRRHLNSSSKFAILVREQLVAMRASFLRLDNDYPSERFPRTTFCVATLRPLVDTLTSLYPNSLLDLVRLCQEMEIKVRADLSVAVASDDASLAPSPDNSFVPDDLIGEHHPILQRLLWEINRTYGIGCYNSCAVILRRLTETLIVLAYTKLGIQARIQNAGNFVDFSALIGAAANEPQLGLTRNTKRILPELKFLGDLGAHNRNALVRKGDLEKVYQSARSSIEEFYQIL